MSLKMAQCTVILLLSFIVLPHQFFESANLPGLPKTHPTWSFEDENIKEILLNSASQLKGRNANLTMAKPRPRIYVTMGPNATRIVRDVDDLKRPKDDITSFDAREHWKHCAKLIGDIGDEGACLTDAPVAVAAVASDRLCIHTNGTFRERLSAEMLTGCAESCTQPPSIKDSYDYLINKGIPTGGPYNSKKGCLSYVEEPCKHSSEFYLGGAANKGGLKCSKEAIFEHVCPDKCSNAAYPKSLDDDRKRSSWYVLYVTDDMIMEELLEKGPVIASMDLYDDFLQRPRGVYRTRLDAKPLGIRKHFKIIGWGKQKETPYWLAVNSWRYWGRSKVFKIPRAKDPYLPELSVSSVQFD